MTVLATPLLPLNHSSMTSPHPTITTTVGGTNDNRTVSASDNDTGTTTMLYKIITSGTTCNASTMSSGTTSYTESNTITIAAADNGKKVCFSSTDAAGNIGYQATAALVTGSGLSATVGPVPIWLSTKQRHHHQLCNHRCSSAVQDSSRVAPVMLPTTAQEAPPSPSLANQWYRHRHQRIRQHQISLFQSNEDKLRRPIRRLYPDNGHR